MELVVSSSNSHFTFPIYLNSDFFPLGIQFDWHIFYSSFVDSYYMWVATIHDNHVNITLAMSLNFIYMLITTYDFYEPNVMFSSQT